MLISKTAMVKWNARNKKRLVELGYVFTKMNDEVEIDVKYLSKGSNAIVNIQCDYCGKEYLNMYQQYYAKNTRTLVKKDCCPDCLQDKAKESLVSKYGTSNHIALKEIRDKSKATTLKHYGVENPFQASEVKEKIANTNLKKYGVKSYKQTKECQIKIANTCLRRYGQTSHMKLDRYRIMFQKENSPTWKGGVKYHRVERATFEYRQWRTSVFERDQYTCQCCRKKGGTYLQAHHIKNWKDHLDDRYEVSNGITLCKNCHERFHSKYGKRFNTPSQTEEFIKSYDKDVCQTATN